MSDDWYSARPRTRFSREHRELLPRSAKMIDVDQVLWAPYEGILGRPIMLCEVKPESPREDFWGVTRSLAQLAAIPAAKIIERQDGTYDVFLAQESNGYEPHLLGHGMTIHDWYDFVESRFRRST